VSEIQPVGQRNLSGPLILGGDDILSLLTDKESIIIQSVENAYRIHRTGDTSLPHSSFLTFPDNATDRIIALPAYLGGDVKCAGIKWVSSFPENIQHGVDRASAILILNSLETGRPKAIMEGSIVSAKRTAASAALAARTLCCKETSVVGFIGCGVINFEIARFLRHTCPSVQTFLIFDVVPDQAFGFRQRCIDTFPEIAVAVATDINSVLKGAALISFATTATTPHVQDLSACSPGSVVLNISLRDLSSAAVLANDNVVDDIDHVCRAKTSIHLAEQRVGNRGFVRCSLADILRGDGAPKAAEHNVSIFSPFGLGILDVALGELVYSEALSQGKGSICSSFFPTHNSERKPPSVGSSQGVHVAE
jgi:N-[(2S)-2-amino-2-carboxyethyl]-L-glutamate dehydrogenase